MARRAGTILLLLAAFARPEVPAAELTRLLGDRDPVRRRIAAARLLEMGPRAWPALEEALRETDPEVAGTARRILRAWAWVPPHLRATLHAARRRALFGTVPAARSRAVRELQEAGDAGRAALEYVFAGPPAAFRIEEQSARRTYYDLAPEVSFRMRNASRHPGWAPPRLGSVLLMHWRPFGRAVTYPVREERSEVPRRRFLSKGKIEVENTTFIAETEWVAPGTSGSTPRHVSLVAPQPGIATFRVGEVCDSYPGGKAIAHPEPGRLIAIGNPLPFDVPVSLVPRMFTYYLLPPESVWGGPVDGARVEARRDGGRVHVRLASDFVAHAPRDFGSAWYVAVDARNEVVAHGPLDGAGDEARTYAQKDLEFVPRPPDALERSFPMPDLPEDAVRLFVGASFTRGRAPSGYTAVARPVDLR